MSIKSIKEKFSRLFCNHKYLTLIGFLDCTFVSKGKENDVPIIFWECPKCGHRFVNKEDDFYYNKTTLELIELWQNHKINLRVDENMQVHYV
nr:MAG TPA: MqsA [Caudoviricetes sp.]